MLLSCQLAVEQRASSTRLHEASDTLRIISQRSTSGPTFEQVVHHVAPLDWRRVGEQGQVLGYENTLLGRRWRRLQPRERLGRLAKEQRQLYQTLQIRAPFAAQRLTPATLHGP